MGTRVPEDCGSKRTFKAKGLTKRVAVGGKRHKGFRCVLLKKGKTVRVICKRLPVLQREMVTRRFFGNGLCGV